MVIVLVMAMAVADAIKGIPMLTTMKAIVRVMTIRPMTLRMMMMVMGAACWPTVWNDDQAWNSMDNDGE